MIYLTKSEKETFDIAVEYAKTLKPGDVILLSGDLGAGKTVFTKGLAVGLNISDEVTSPTYAYLNVYGDYLYHYDCYRLSCGEDAELLGLTDYFNGDNICVIEWSENILDVLPNNTKKVVIEKLSEFERKITLL
ncbi:MAG: tRNA (adenosine(37)-N6)-threonylcarbamoyltransferase complex ATPase subunit type 1 TsaE [Clostridia bacterium]|nr:tRNA (adenosine(37)-N6)-threonylcarbamoyltransferase complex ATPase subunit type 1 TsaE [Clostridia bacterium]